MDIEVELALSGVYGLKTSLMSYLFFLWLSLCNLILVYMPLPGSSNYMLYGVSRVIKILYTELLPRLPCIRSIRLGTNRVVN